MNSSVRLYITRQSFFIISFSRNPYIAKLKDEEVPMEITVK